MKEFCATYNALEECKKLLSWSDLMQLLSEVKSMICCTFQDTMQKTRQIFKIFYNEVETEMCKVIQIVTDTIFYFSVKVFPHLENNSCRIEMHLDKYYL